MPPPEYINTETEDLESGSFLQDDSRHADIGATTTQDANPYMDEYKAYVLVILTTKCFTS